MLLMRLNTFVILPNCINCVGLLVVHASTEKDKAYICTFKETSCEPIAFQTINKYKALPLSIGSL